jgi:hypothetical protein
MSDVLPTRPAVIAESHVAPALTLKVCLDQLLRQFFPEDDARRLEFAHALNGVLAEHIGPLEELLRQAEANHEKLVVLLEKRPAKPAKPAVAKPPKTTAKPSTNGKQNPVTEEPPLALSQTPDKIAASAVPLKAAPSVVPAPSASLTALQKILEKAKQVNQKVVQQGGCAVKPDGVQ